MRIALKSQKPDTRHGPLRRAGRLLRPMRSSAIRLTCKLTYLKLTFLKSTYLKLTDQAHLNTNHVTSSSSEIPTGRYTIWSISEGGWYRAQLFEGDRMPILRTPLSVSVSLSLSHTHSLSLPLSLPLSHCTARSSLKGIEWPSSRRVSDRAGRLFLS